MPILVECDECGAKFRLDDRHAGRVLPCKHCGADIDVPGGRGGAAKGGRRSPARKAKGGIGWPVWAGIGGGVAVLALVLVLVFTGGDDEPAQPPQANNGFPGASNRPDFSNRPRAIPQPTTNQGQDEARLRHEWITRFTRERGRHGSSASGIDRPVSQAFSDAITATIRNRDNAARERLVADQAAFFRDRFTLPHSPEVREAVRTYGQQRLTQEQSYLDILKELQQSKPNGLPNVFTQQFDDVFEKTQANVLKLQASLERLDIVSDLPNVAANTPGGSAPNVTTPDAIGGDGSNRPAGTAPKNSDPSPVTPPAQWSVRVDPPQPETQLTGELDFSVTMAADLTPRDVVFSRAPSPFVAIGNNRNERSERDVWDLRTKKKLGTVTGQNLWTASSVALSPNGKWFAVDYQRKLLVWDVAAEKFLGNLPMEWPKAIRFAGDRIVTIGGFGKTEMVVWSLPSGQKEHTLDVSRWVSTDSVATSPGGRYAALVDTTDDRKNQVVVYDVTTGQQTGATALPDVGFFGATCRTLVFSPDGTELAGLFDRFDEGHVRVTDLWCWDVITGRLTTRIELGDVLQNIGPSNAFGWPLEFFPDKSRWLVYGLGIVDRKAEGLVWTFPQAPNSTGPRRVLGNGQVTAMVVDAKKKRQSFNPLPLPTEEIAKSAAVIAAGGSLKDIHLPMLTAADVASLKTVTATGAVPWNVQVDPAPSGGGSLQAAVTLEKRNAKLNGLLLSNAAAAKAALFYAKDDFSTRGPRTRGVDSIMPDLDPVWIELYDLTTGKAGTVVEVPFQSELVAFSPSGKSLLMRLAGDEDRLDVFSAEDGRHLAGWRPYQKLLEDHQAEAAGNRNAAFSVRRADVFTEGKGKVSAAAFIDDNHVLTLNGDFFIRGAETTLILWELPSCRAVYQLDDPGKPGISPNGRYLVVSMPNGFRFLDARTGEVAGVVDAQGIIGAAAFHTDGQRFAAVTTDGPDIQLRVWNLSDGSVLEDIPLAKAAEWMHWCGDGHLLLDGERLVDVDRGMVVWRYKLPRHTGVHSPVSPDGRHWYLSSSIGPNSQLRLIGADLPEQAARDQIAAANPQPEFLLKPGGTVALQVQAGPLGGNLDREVEKNLTEQFRKHNVTIDPSAALTMRLEVSQETGNEVNLQVTNLRTGETSTESYQETRIVCRTIFQSGGQTVWENTSSYGNAFTGMIEEGKSFQQAGSERAQNSAAAFMRSIRPPKFVLSPKTADGIGESSL